MMMMMRCGICILHSCLSEKGGPGLRPSRDRAAASMEGTRGGHVARHVERNGEWWRPAPHWEGGAWADPRGRCIAALAARMAASLLRAEAWYLRTARRSLQGPRSGHMADSKRRRLWPREAWRSRKSLSRVSPEVRRSMSGGGPSLRRRSARSAWPRWHTAGGEVWAGEPGESLAPLLVPPSGGPSRPSCRNVEPGATSSSPVPHGDAAPEHGDNKDDGDGGGGDKEEEEEDAGCCLRLRRSSDPGRVASPPCGPHSEAAPDRRRWRRLLLLPGERAGKLSGWIPKSEEAL